MPCWLKPTTQNPEDLNCQSVNRFPRACQSRLHYCPRKTPQALTEYLHCLFILPWGSCSVWTCSRLAPAMSGTTEYAADLSCVTSKRSEGVPENMGTQEGFKQLFLSTVFWQSLKNKKKFLPPAHLAVSSNVNSREHLIRKDSSWNLGLCGAGLWHFLLWVV